MGIGSIGLPELIFILVIILLFFGAKRIPEIAGSFGKGIKEFKKSMNDVERSINEPMREERFERPSAATDQAAVRRVTTGTDDEDRPEPKRLMS